MDYSTIYLFIAFVALGVVIVLLNYLTHKRKQRLAQKSGAEGVAKPDSELGSESGKARNEAASVSGAASARSQAGAIEGDSGEARKSGQGADGAGAGKAASTGKDPMAIRGFVASERPAGCCGLHEVCEKEFAKPAEIIYFADEELDAYAGRAADDYNDQEIAEFEDVLLTLRESEIPDWLLSLRSRSIELPTCIKEEAYMIIGDNVKA